MGEVLAGILLGPDASSARIAPERPGRAVPDRRHPATSGSAANLGLIFYMFLVGLELDLGQLRGPHRADRGDLQHRRRASRWRVGLAVALPIYELVGAGHGRSSAFALFMGVSMSITAFPVLARILVERRMLKRPVGALALASGGDRRRHRVVPHRAGDRGRDRGLGVGRRADDRARDRRSASSWASWSRPLLGARVAAPTTRPGACRSTWITAIFAGVLLSAYTTEEIGIALIFGAFVMGAIMPRHAGLTEDVTHRIEDFVVLLLLPLFFAYTGLRTDVGLLDRPELVVLTLVLLAVAIVVQVRRRDARRARHGPALARVRRASARS